MWQVLAAAAVAGSGLVARKVFSSAAPLPQHSDQRLADLGSSSVMEYPSKKLAIDGDELNHSSPRLPDQSCTGNLEEQGGDQIFRFSSFGSKSKKNVLRGNHRLRKKKKGVEVERLERRFSVCLKRRKTGKSGSVDSGACCFSGNTNSLFGWGVGIGIMYMMSTGQSEINKLNATMDQTVKAVGELKNELCKRKASCISKSSCTADRVTCEGGEYPSSILTEEPEPQHAAQEMEQPEADLEYELSKLTSCATEVSFDKVIDSKLYQTEVLANSCQQMCHSHHFKGVEPSVLDKKLSQLLIQQQESQINELEHELQSANSKLHQKEAELRALKDCVRRLSSVTLSNIPENETEITAEAMLVD